MGQVVVVDHPLVQHKLAVLRDRQTAPEAFRAVLEEIAILLACEATRQLATAPVDIETPLARTRCAQLRGRPPAVVPILRAGLGMLGGVLRLIPDAAVGHVGLARNETTHQPQEYYCKLPGDLHDRDIILLDPMLATGGSALAAIQILKERGAGHIHLMCVVASAPGITAVTRAHGDIDIITAAVDPELNAQAYIVPGLGDAGDRLFGTL